MKFLHGLGVFQSESQSVVNKDHFALQKLKGTETNQVPNTNLTSYLEICITSQWGEKRRTSKV